MNFRNVKMLLLMLVLVVLVACGSDSGSDASKYENGLNEITLKQAEKMLENKESFLLLTFAIDEDDLKESKAIEALGDSLKRANLTSFYVNLYGESDDVILGLEGKYTHPSYINVEDDTGWEADEDGLVWVKEGSVLNEIDVDFYERMISDSLERGELFEPKDFDEEVAYIAEYIEHYKVELDY